MSTLPFELDPETVASLLGEGSVQLVDVREQYERDVGHVGGSSHVPLDSLREAAESGAIDPSLPVVFVCRVGSRSAMAAWSFARAGFDAHNLTGGLVEWSARGLPLEGRVSEH